MLSIIHFCSGFVACLVLGPEDRDGFIETETWLALGSTEARQTAQFVGTGLDGSDDPITTIVNGNTSWGAGGETHPAMPLDPDACFGVGANPLVQALPCFALFDYELQTTEMRVHPEAESEAQQVIEGDGPDTFDWWALFGAETHLPLGIVMRMEDRPAERPSEFTVEYRTEFISRDSLPDDFFDTASIGYPEDD